MAETTYVLCAALSACCAFLLFRQYRARSTRLLFWTGLCFAGLALNSLLLVLDLITFPHVDLSVWRTSIALASLAALLFGFVWNTP